MLISPKHKFVFLGIPRTGTTSMYVALRSVAGPGAIYTGKHDMKIPQQYRKFFTIAFTRNPYSREVSHYLYRHTKPANALYPWVKDWGFAKYIRWSTSREIPPHDFHDKPVSTHLHSVRVDMLLRFEDLPDAFYKIPIVKKTGVSLPNRNACLKSKPWQPFYTAAIARRVAEWAAQDFKLYGYGLRSWRRR